MSFSYTRMSREECERERGFELIPNGTYNFEVIGATHETSKSSGNPMIALKLRVWDDQGKDHLVFDYLVATPKMMWKTLHFCDSVGLTKEYDQGLFNESLCIGKSGKAVISISAGNKKPDGTYYKDKNIVDDYLVAELGSLKNTLPETTSNDDDVPF